MNSNAEQVKRLMDALPDEGQMEHWRQLSDDLLKGGVQVWSAPKIREAALQLQNAYLAGQAMHGAVAAIQGQGAQDEDQFDTEMTQRWPNALTPPPGQAPHNSDGSSQ